MYYTTTYQIVTQRLSFAGHCFRSKEVVHKLILWEPKFGKNTRERPARNFVNQLTDDTDVDKEDLETAMNDREYWKNYLKLLGSIPRGPKISTCSTVCFRYIKFVASALIYKEKRFIYTALHYIKCWKLINEVVEKAPKKAFSKARTKVKGSEAGTIISAIYWVRNPQYQMIVVSRFKQYLKIYI